MQITANPVKGADLVAEGSLSQLLLGSLGIHLAERNCPVLMLSEPAKEQTAWQSCVDQRGQQETQRWRSRASLEEKTAILGNLLLQGAEDFQ